MKAGPDIKAHNFVAPAHPPIIPDKITQRVSNSGPAFSKAHKLSTIQKIMRGTGAFLKGALSPMEWIRLKNLIGPQAMLFYAGIEGGMVSYDKLAKGIPWKEGISESAITLKSCNIFLLMFSDIEMIKVLLGMYSKR